MQTEISQLDRFESLGDNPELGFVLRALGSEKDSLFRWARVSPWQVFALLRREFAGLYAFDQLRPLQDDMVTDGYYGCGWPSLIASADRGAGREFVQPEADRRQIHAEEARRLHGLAQGFLQRLRSGGLILVIKSGAGIEPACMDLLLAELARLADGAPFWLLELRRSPNTNLQGTVRQPSQHHLVGTLGAFASDARAADADLLMYRRVLAAAELLAPRAAPEPAPPPVVVAAPPPVAVAPPQPVVAAPPPPPPPTAAPVPPAEATLPFPSKLNFGGDAPALDFAWGKVALLNPQPWSRALETGFRLHAFPAGLPVTMLHWHGVRRPGLWTLAASIACPVADSLPVQVTLAVRVNGQVSTQRVSDVAPGHPVDLAMTYRAAEGDDVAFELKAVCPRTIAEGERAVVDVAPLRLAPAEHEVAA